MRPLNAPEWPFVGEIHRVEDTYWRFLKATGWTEFVPTALERAQHAITEAAEEAAHHDRMCELISMGVDARSGRANGFRNTVVREEHGYLVHLEMRRFSDVFGFDHVIADAHLEAALVTPLLFNAYMDSWVRHMITEVVADADQNKYMSADMMVAKVQAIRDLSTATGVTAQKAAEQFKEFSRLLLRDPSQGKP